METRVTPSVSFSIPARRRAFCPDGALHAERLLSVLVRKAARGGHGRSVNRSEAGCGVRVGRERNGETCRGAMMAV